MRRPHHDAPLVRQLRILRNRVERKRAGMHRRPQRVSMQPQQQLKDPLIRPRPDVPFAIIDGGIHLLRRPRPQPPILIVKENPSILYGWLRLHMQAGANVHRRMMRDWHIRPPRPRRDAHLPRNLKQRIRNAAPVRSGNHQRMLHSRHRRGDHRRNRRLPLAGDCRGVKFSPGHKRINLRRLAEDADQDQLRRQRCGKRSQHARLHAGDLLHIGCKGLRRYPYRLGISWRNINPRSAAIRRKRKRRL